MAHETTTHWYNVFVTEFARESDRASVILSVALLDQALEAILRARLVPVPAAEDPMFEGPFAPLSTFSARIDMAHRLGLTTTQFCRDLHIIRRIRNEFAHNVSGANFEASAVRSRVAELSRAPILAQRTPEQVSVFPPGPRGAFQAMVSWMLWHLWEFEKSVVALAAPLPEFGYFDRKLLSGDSETHTGTEPGA